MFSRRRSWIMVMTDAGAGAVSAVDAALDRVGRRDQLVVVDAGSTDGTADVVFDARGAEPRLTIVVVDHPTKRPASIGAAAARHPAFDLATGDPLIPGQPSGVLLQEPVPARAVDDSIATDRVVLMPAAAYHLDELGPLADELENRGVPTAFFASEWRWADVVRRLRRQRQPVFGWDGSTSWVDGAAALVTLNDWAKALKPYLDRANEHAIPTVAKVEGVQDFEDIDVHWTRNAYRTASLTLCQGTNDQTALQSHPTAIVGNSRLEKIWTLPYVPRQSDVAVINLNFTYGVLENAREAWLAEVIRAVRRAGLTPLVSRHPAETGVVRDAAVADASMSHLLTTCGVLISRFSTVPFEAMARSTPFVYYNPHGEKVPTFLDPAGAYEATDDPDALVEAIRRAAADGPTSRDRAESFFRRQVDIGSRSSAERAADVVCELLGTGGAG